MLQLLMEEMGLALERVVEVLIWVLVMKLKSMELTSLSTEHIVLLKLVADGRICSRSHTDGRLCLSGNGPSMLEFL